MECLSSASTNGIQLPSLLSTTKVNALLGHWIMVGCLATMAREMHMNAGRGQPGWGLGHEKRTQGGRMWKTQNGGGSPSPHQEPVNQANGNDKHEANHVTLSSSSSSQQHGYPLVLTKLSSVP